MNPMLTKLRQLLGLKEGEKDFILQFIIDKVSDMVCNYCNIEKIPKRLEDIVLNMCVDMYRAESLGQETPQGSIKGITEGDVSVSFGSLTSSTEDSGMRFLRNYIAQLQKFRKLVW